MSTKVFVGNLAFRTTDQALQEAFSKHGEVKSGVIITRGRRSLGYGFVEFATTEQASASVDKMNKAEIFGRQIKVELAKDLVERPDQNDEVGPARRRKRAGDDGNDAASGNRSSNTSTTTNTTTNSNNKSNNNTNAGNNNTGSSDKGSDDRQLRRKRPRARRNNNGPDNNNNSNNNNDNPAPKSERPPRPPREEKEKVPSKTTLFVANLPFSIDDAQLLAAFSGVKAKAAHVVVTNSGRSRGYGFVEFETEADQLEALKTHNGKPIVGKTGTRNMSVSISHTPPTDAPATSN